MKVLRYYDSKTIENQKPLSKYTTVSLCILFGSCYLCSIKVEFPFKSAAADENRRKICGHFNVSDNASFYIYDRENHNKGFAKILASDGIHENISSVTIEKDCELIYCAINLFVGKQRFCERFAAGFVALTDEKYSFSVAASCSCKTVIPGCDKTKCEILRATADHNRSDNDKTIAGTCAAFYKEPNCSRCRYEPYNLAENITIHPTNNSFAVESIVVRENCTLEIKSLGFPSAYYQGIYNSVQLSYVQKYKPAEFTCICGTKIDAQELIIASTNDINENNSTEISFNNNNNSNEFNKPWIITLLVLASVILLFFSVTILYKYVTAKRKLQKMFAEAIKRFKEGINVNADNLLAKAGGQSNIAFEDEEEMTPSDSLGEAYYIQSNNYSCHYISMGYKEALRTPYYFQYEKPRHNVIVQENIILGKGNFGEVCLGELHFDIPAKTSTSTGSNIIDDGSQTPQSEKIQVAVKIAKGSTSIIYFVSLLDEIKILSFLGSHPNIVSIVGACTQNINQRDALLLLEYCSKGSLKKYLDTNRSLMEIIQVDLSRQQKPTTDGNETPNNGVILPVPSSSYTTWQDLTALITINQETFAKLLKWAAEIANGMEFLSNKKVVHIDLAARNILLTQDLTAKVSDFGLSRRIHDLGHYARVGEDYRLPISWMALESLEHTKFTIESDIWSYGVLLWELFTLGDEPYKEHKMDLMELIKYLRTGKRLKKPKHSTEEIYSVILKCWELEPQSRPSFHGLKDIFDNMHQKHCENEFGAEDSTDL